MYHQRLSLYFWLSLICYSNAETTIYPFDSIITLPSSSIPLQLESSIVLSCGIEPPLYVPSTFWVTPQGTVVDEAIDDPHYFFTEGQIFQNNRRIYSTILQINGLSYADSGNYSCVVDISTSAEPNTRAQSTVELRLLSNLTTEQQVVTPSTGVTNVNLTCEMSLYTLPDENLLWINTNGTAIEKSEKYTITFENGSQHVAQNGGNQRSPSRVSTLTIHNPTHCDNGTYSCVLVETPNSNLINVILQVPQTDDELTCAVSGETTVNGSTKLCSSPLSLLCLSLLYLTVMT